ncbi:hypothetical protein FJ414_23445 [Mesorhizobium sp. B3-1-6]|uniref:hypothetical protein n=1 Tax=Mesorhizobium sp. B3-1-6 TaxID=2589895 RepID=UPI001129311F|nr:hypothetical protein [Mesorhizobium sp. B3-1-6]TPI31516.1 hypothetical protein FJ414_23445 [Mesorhizobium sp. B3-1-6]
MKWVITIAAVGVMLSPQARAEPGYKLNKAMTAAVALSNLSPGGACVAGRASGRIVAVRYNEMQTVPVLFTIAEKSGERTLINIDVDELQNASMLAQGWVVPALQKMVRKGRTVNLGIKLCGAAGRVIMLDAIK